MVTVEEWLSVLEAYSITIWPAQIFFYIAAILITGWFLLKPAKILNVILKLYFVVVFAWNGVMWYFILAKDIAGESYGNYFFGSIFILVSILFAVDIFRQKMLFIFPTGGWQRYATLTLLILVFSYPIIGAVWGHDSSRLIYPGTYPCPTTALGIVLLTTAIQQVNKTIFFLLLFLAVPFTPFVQIFKYGVYEDIILFASGVYGLILYMREKHA